MRHIHDQEPTSDVRRTPSRSRPPDVDAASAELVRLQRAAGNAAVARLLGEGATGQRSTAVQRRPAAPAATKPAGPVGPGGTFAPARTTTALIGLVREAEQRLTASGIASIDERIQVISGIYYGTNWSLDFKEEKSEVRNAAFQIYTGRLGPGDDPRPVLGSSLYAAIRSSQDVSHPRLGKVDVGHLIIGLNARQSWPARAVAVPTQGATGLEITTWVGDLGGAAGQLARRRGTAPSTPASAFFTGTRGTDYGADSNLEGDVAAYVVGAAPEARSPSAMAVPPGGGIADTLELYFVAAGATADRASKFLRMVGGSFSGAALSNRGAVERAMATKFHDFGRWYMTTRYGPGVLLQIEPALAASAADVATEFVNWLLRRIPGGAPPGGTPATQPDLVDQAIELFSSWAR